MSLQIVLEPLLSLTGDLFNGFWPIIAIVVAFIVGNKMLRMVIDGINGFTDSVGDMWDKRDAKSGSWEKYESWYNDGFDDPDNWGEFTQSEAKSRKKRRKRKS